MKTEQSTSFPFQNSRGSKEGEGALNFPSPSPYLSSLEEWPSKERRKLHCNVANCDADLPLFFPLQESKEGEGEKKCNPLPSPSLNSRTGHFLAWVRFDKLTFFWCLLFTWHVGVKNIHVRRWLQCYPKQEPASFRKQTWKYVRNRSFIKFWKVYEKWVKCAVAARKPSTTASYYEWRNPPFMKNVCSVVFVNCNLWNCATSVTARYSAKPITTGIFPSLLEIKDSMFCSAREMKPTNM